MKLPALKIGAKPILKSPEELALVEMRLKGVMLDPQAGVYVALEAEGDVYHYAVNAQEGAMLTFARSGCSVNSHIKNIYQLYLETMQHVGHKLETATVEAKAGDIYYARLGWRDHKHRQLFTVCSVGDALILSILSGAKLQIIKAVLEQMEAADDDWHTEQEVYEE